MTKLLTSEMVSLAMNRSKFSDHLNDSTYMFGFLRGFVSHMERTVPGVKDAIQEEITRLKVQKFNTEK